MHSFFKALFFTVTVVLFASCDKDFNELGSDIVGDDHYGFSKDSLTSVIAYDQQLGAVQTSKTTSSNANLLINSLGYYNNPVFGKTTASFVTQLEMASTNPTFGDSVHVKKVLLTVPYFSTRTDTDDDGNNTYELDSIKGSGKIKLDVYASNYYLRDLDPASGFQDPQRYYSDQSSDFNNNIDPTHLQRLNDTSAVAENDQFFFNAAEILTYEDVNGEPQIDTRTPPEMHLSLNRTYFREKIFGLDAAGNTINNAAANLVNNNIFKEYLRGLYFKVSPASGAETQGSLAQMNFGNGKVTITYSVLTNRKNAQGQFILVDGRREREDKTFVLNMKGNTVNLFEHEDNANYIAAVTNSDPINGDEKLYLKGGAGSMAIIDLFGTADNYYYGDHDNNASTPFVIINTANGIPDQLDDLRQKGWLINEANLTFYVDKVGMAGAPEPNRLYLYDLTNKRPLVDYFLDVTTLGSNPKFNKYVHDGIIQRDEDDRGIRYKVRLTNHIKNLAKADLDSTNVRLGLVVTESISNISNARLKNPVSPTIDRVPAASVGNPLGTILYGSHSNVPENKRLKLVIYYTKPD